MEGNNPENNPTAPVYWTDANGNRFNVNDPNSMVTLIDLLGSTIGTLRNDLVQAQGTIATLQQTPLPDAQQWTQLVEAITTRQRTPAFTPGRNPVLSTATTEVLYTDYAPPSGAVDIKGFSQPGSFNGARNEADPFIDRCLTYFEAKPHAMRLAKTRILFACSLVTEYPASHWAQQVSAAITC